MRNAIVTPLSTQGAEGIPDSLAVMDAYSLLREDLDNLLEVSQWPDKPEPMKNVDSKVKAAFTRAYNKESSALPYSVTQNVSKKRAAAPTSFEIEDEEEEEEEEDEDDIDKDAMIKVRNRLSRLAIEVM